MTRVETGSVLGGMRSRFERAREVAADRVARAEQARVAPQAPAPQRQQLFRLREIAIELTSKCNLSCEMCSVWKGARDGLDRDRIIALLDEARGLGARIFSTSGAEIFMRKDTPQILMAAQRLGYERISVVTNGTLVARHAATLAAIPALSLGVSIDGPEKVHDALRGPGTYRKAVEGVRALRRKGVEVHLNGVLMQPTLATAGQLIDLAIELGLSRVSFQPFQPEIAWDQDDHSRWVFAPEDRGRVAEALGGLLQKARLAGIAIATESMFPAIPPYLFDGIRPVPPGGCFLPSRFLLVSRSGDTFPCFFMRGQSMGNVAEGVRLRDIWHGPVQRRMQARGLAGDCPGCLAGCSDVESFNRSAGRPQA
jgi:MoaA/NifB/PqqE/SkfB family radical SAM enzyme